MNAEPDTLTSASNDNGPPQEHPMPDIPIETIDGVECTNRDGLAILTGLSSKTMSIYAGTDPDFPTPHGNRRINRTYWYELAAARAYAATLAARAEQGKPPAVEAGDPDELLSPDAAAEAIGVSRGTFKRYVNDSKPYWDGVLEGRPLLPKPDVENEAENNLGTYTAREWRRGSLAEHQAGRPGTHGNTAAGGAPRGRPAAS